MARKKARLAAKIADSKATAKAAAAPRGNARVPPKIPPRTYRARRAAEAESPTSPPSLPPSLPPPDPPTKPETLSCGYRRSLPRIPWRTKHVQDDDVAPGPTHKKLKTDCASPNETSKRKPRRATNSGRAQRNTKARLGLSSCQPARYLPRPVKPGNLSASTVELAAGYHPAPIRGTPLANGASVTPLAKTTSAKKRTNENTIVKSAVTKRPKKEYFQEGMVLKYESDDDAEAMNGKLDTKGAQSTPLPVHTSTASAATPTSMAKPKSPLASTLGKRTSTGAQSPDAGDAGNTKVKKEYLEEETTSDYESDEKPIADPKAYLRRFSSRVVDYQPVSPPSLTDFPTRALRHRRARYTIKEEESSSSSD
ncbi:hypothetical protein B9Z19DRAFT_1063601 [Tuber borchii]|uniref:Uncharacterized protein n=1 Tax=Tuber borchii TaxID=42251 RepID=A0A2T6ZXN8_TUBBO|nr:hypothetical protein B9Z19DRAFT_1063601 [Tuber borchii]